MASLMLFRLGDLVCFRCEKIHFCQIERCNGFCLLWYQMSTRFVRDSGGWEVEVPGALIDAGDEVSGDLPSLVC